jgi:hypothetical protein
LLFVDPQDDKRFALVVDFPYEPIRVFRKVDAARTLPVVFQRFSPLGVLDDPVNFVFSRFPCVLAPLLKLAKILARLGRQLDAKLGDGFLLVFGGQLTPKLGQGHQLALAGVATSEV